MRILVGKVMFFVPFVLVLLCQPFFASQVGGTLAGVALVTAASVVQLAQTNTAFDPFSTHVLPTSAVVLEEATAEDESIEGVNGVNGVVTPADTSIAKGGSRTGKSRAKAPTDSKIKPLPSVRVTEAVVLRLAQMGRVPKGTPVAASGNRPAGIQVFGVSALGIGVRDGDVLTHVSGVPVSHAGQVIAMVVAARGARKPLMIGRLWRGNRSYTIVVEQPYLRKLEAAPTPPVEPVTGLGD